MSLKKNHQPALASAGAIFALAASSLNAAVVVSLTTPTGGTPYSTPGYQSFAGNVLNDPFAYNPNALAGSVVPDQSDPDQSFNAMFLTTNNDAQNFWTASLAMAGGDTLSFLDVWGRDDYAGSEQSRHQSLTITLSNGVNSWTSAAWSGVSARTASPSSFGRFDFGSAGVTNGLLASATSIRIDHVAGNNDYMLLAEVRAVAVPEPGMTILGGFGLFGLLRRRRA